MRYLIRKGVFYWNVEEGKWMDYLHATKLSETISLILEEQLKKKFPSDDPYNTPHRVEVR